MSFNPKAECIRKTINNSSTKDFLKFDKKTFNPEKIKKDLPIISPKLYNLINNIIDLDTNDFAKYGKKFKHIIYSDLRNSLAGIKLVAAAFTAYDMTNIYDKKFIINIPEKDNNFALLSSVAIYDKPFPVKLRNEILKIFNARPDNIYGENIRYLLIDQGFKEGIDVFDVKYVHIFDDLLTPSDEKQAIGRGTRFCGQKGLEFNASLGWPLHVFKYKLLLNKDMETKYGEKDGFSLFLKEGNIDVKKLYFASELENICRFGAVDYEINKAIHEFGNEKEDDLDVKNIFNKYNAFETFKLKDDYSSLEKNKANEFDLLKKARYNFGGVKVKTNLFKNKKTLGLGINKKRHNFIDITKVQPINKILVKKLDFIDMRKYTRKYFNNYKWTNLIFENKCITPAVPNVANNRIVSLSNSQAFVSNFFTAKSAYKGILFWHSVGTGKTCSAIATASNSFEKEDYTILWVTRHTLKPDIWKNIYTQICSATIKEKLENGIYIPEVVKANPLKYLNNKWITPISYKQFSNLITGKNSFYNDLVKRNGKKDPLRKTLIIIDEAHKLFAEDTPANERPDIKILKTAIYNSYNFSQENSCKLLLMTATPYTSNPMQLFQLLNLLKEDDYFIEDFDKFKEYYLDDLYNFRKDKSKEFLDKITGYISYLNREKDVRQFAYPVIYIKDVEMSSRINKKNIYSYFFEDIKDYASINLEDTKEIVNNLKQINKNKANANNVITQEEAFELCMSKKTKKGKQSSSILSSSSSNNSKSSSIIKEKKKKEIKIDIIKEFIKEMKIVIKDCEKINKEEEKAKKKAQKEEEKARKKEEKARKKA